ncbi:hypothetical protein M8756_13270 [Lutimaribacter sp. EGI FJ00015]|uniref:Uncharacterized protein n=1 Tax=Lutimaribacter degradans TaxID=2945989 RepID=A0ACC5ZXP4_9RHOB|nr:hypothetical protein [Lutimaribacter sp. EGI FJ00013]MCM2563104.1 hypothetical protein [Lutimaribacter sp. EGI FJ00013]MCO0614283.1 hypothetical protein [Lutimaribacter sp. EGI FJ00015]MCO0637093.1 hypothetical protein [Lutimaribacter sp. EGI FJ00014]
MRMVVHAGFHKTGTTSIQHMLRRNGRKIARYYRVLTRRQMLATCEAARAFSLGQSTADLGLFTFELAQLFETLDPADPRPVLISAEDLSGHMPGRFGLTGYDAAPRLMATLEEVAQACLPGLDLHLVFTTRAAAPWLRSTYAQHVRAIRFTEAHDTYLARMAEHADLSAWAARIDAATSAPVTIAPLETHGAGRLGPLTALLDVAGAPAALRDRLTPLPPANPSFPDHVIAEMLALNRSDMDHDDWVAAKKQLMEAWRAQIAAP